MIVENKNKIRILILIIVLLVGVIGLTFAYFISGVGDDAITDLDVTTEKEARLVFTPGGPIEIVSSLNNFSDGSGSLSGTTTSTAKLTSSTTEAVVSEEYYVYYNITDNNYVYTQNDTTPELILEVTDPEGNVINNIDGLSYVTVTDALTGEDISGFDVTTYKGLIAIKENMPISSTFPNDTTHEWDLKITFVNLDADQSLNEGKEFKGELILREDEMVFLNESVLANNGGVDYIESRPIPNFSQTATTNEGMFAAEDDYGTSYYFRGAVDDNWVYFAGFYWRIVRINGDGSIRMIYSGSTQPTESQAVVMQGDGTHIDNSVFNVLHSSVEYVGYMYTLGEQHGMSNSSSIKTVVDAWYFNNLSDYDEYLSDVIYCTDRTSYADDRGNSISLGIGGGNHFFGAVIRNQTSKVPSLECPRKDDSFTVDDIVNGNGALDVPIGMLNTDESAMAGTGVEMANSNYYLYNNLSFWLLSPGNRYGGIHYSYNIFSNGALRGNNNTYSYGVRPVISLKSSVSASGSGTWNDPYVVK